MPTAGGQDGHVFCCSRYSAILQTFWAKKRTAKKGTKHVVFLNHYLLEPTSFLYYVILGAQYYLTY